MLQSHCLKTPWSFIYAYMVCKGEFNDSAKHSIDSGYPALGQAVPLGSAQPPLPASSASLQPWWGLGMDTGMGMVGVGCLYLWQI